MAEKKNAVSSFQKLMEEGKALYDKALYKEAVKTFKTAQVMSSKLDKFQLGSLYIWLGNSYYNLKDNDKYRYYYELYLKEYPEGQASVFSRLAHAYYYIDVDKSIDYHNKALNCGINQYDSSSKLFAMTKSSYYSQRDIKEESEYETSQIKQYLYKNIQKYIHDDKKHIKNKKLNIGYLSSDCHAHTMMNYIIPIWENHNKEEFNFFIFNGASKKDSVTQTIENIGFKVIPCADLNVCETAKLIYDNNIDILIDLGGYTHLKSYMAFYKPAPIIISYLGYLNTLGISEFDYILADRYSIPEKNSWMYSEKPLYLERGYQIYRGKNLPELSENPYKTNGYITFGSFNCTSKFNDTIVFLWSEILNNTADSKLLIYRTQLTKDAIKYWSDKFLQRGVSKDRILFDNHPYKPHYKAYSQADISLDTYPFNGMSIAIETALMGVPSITLLGEGLQARGVGRINKTLHLDELNAYSGDEYIQKAIELANNKEKLQNLRKVLRGKMLESEIMTCHAEFTHDLEEKYKKIWADFINSP